MPLPIDVRLSTAVVPRFPDRCVVCSADAPRGSYSVSGRLWKWRDLLFVWTWFVRARHTVDAPACEPCAEDLGRRLRKRWWRERFVGLLMVALWLPSAPNRLMRKWVALGVILVGGIVVAALRLRRPLPFDISVMPGGVDYEFLDRSYAEEFAHLNGSIAE